MCVAGESSIILSVHDMTTPNPALLPGPHLLRASGDPLGLQVRAQVRGLRQGHEQVRSLLHRHQLLHPGQDAEVGRCRYWSCQRTFAKFHSAQRKPLPVGTVNMEGEALVGSFRNGPLKIREGSFTALI